MSVSTLFHLDRHPKVPMMALFGTALVIGALTAVFSPWKMFAIMLSVLCIVVTLYRPQVTILFLAVYTTFEPFLLKFISDDIYLYARYFSEGLVYLLVAVVVLRFVTGKQQFVKTPIDLPFLFFLLVMATSIVVNTVPLTTGILGIRQIVRYILLFFAVVQLKPERLFVRRLTFVMIGVTLFEGVLGAVQAIVGGRLDAFLLPSARRFYEAIQLTTGTAQTWEPGTRVFATLGRYDQLGTFLCFFFLLILGLLYAGKTYQTQAHVHERKILYGTLLVAIPGFILTLSRASWFGFLLGFFVVGVVLMKDRRVRYGFAIAVAVIGLYAVFSSLAVTYLLDYPQQTVVERFFESFSYERWRGEYYGLGRLYWIVQTVSVVVPNAPLFGVGPGQYGGGAVAALGNTAAYQKLNLPFGVYGTEGYIDNNWFSLWGETGTIGVVFYGTMFVLLLLMAYRVWRQASDPFTKGIALGYIGCLFALSFQAFLGTYLEVRTIALYFWLYGAMVYSLGNGKHSAVHNS